MNQSPTITELGFIQIEYYMNRYEQLLSVGDIELAEFFRGQAQELAYNLENKDTLTLTYHRWLSDSYGVVFEIEHGDDELMFGGID